MFYSSAEDVSGFKSNSGEKFFLETIIVGARHVRSFEIHDVRPSGSITNSFEISKTDCSQSLMTLGSQFSEINSDFMCLRGQRLQNVCFSALLHRIWLLTSHSFTRSRRQAFTRGKRLHLLFTLGLKRQQCLLPEGPFKQSKLNSLQSIGGFRP